MSQQANISAAFLRLANTIVTLSGRVGTLSALTTTDKTSLVAAINEVKTLVGGAGAAINDTATATGTTWSSSKINTQITSAIAALVNGAPGAQDTLAELATQITALAQADTGLLSFAAVQTLTTPQQLQGCTNLGIGDPAYDFVSGINTALTGTGL